jgi:hypothetical protein
MADAWRDVSSNRSAGVRWPVASTLAELLPVRASSALLLALGVSEMLRAGRGAEFRTAREPGGHRRVFHFLPAPVLHCLRHWPFILL